MVEPKYNTRITRLVAEIRRLRSEKVPSHEIAKRLKISRSTVQRYSAGIVGQGRNIPSPERIEWMQTLYFCRMPIRTIAAQLELSDKTVWGYVTHMDRVDKKHPHYRKADASHVHVWRQRKRAGEWLWSIAADYTASRQLVQVYTADIASTVKHVRPFRYDRERIRAMLSEGLEASIIVERIGCSKELVWHVAMLMRQEKQELQAAA